MTAYPDTNVLVRFYLPDLRTETVSRLVDDYLRREDEALPFTPLHRLEFRNAIRLAVFRSGQAGEVRLSSAEAGQCLRQCEEDIAEGAFLAHQPLDWTEAVREADSLGSRFTESGGFRSLDLFHVGAAKSLGTKEFWSFDAGARKLAQLAGLKVLPARI
jgi:predicted nucleic acid-binding protein